MVTAGQVAGRFRVGRSQCYARLTGLVRLGLLSHQRLLYGQPGVYLATRTGLDLTGVALPAATIDLRTYAHDLEMTSLVSELERDAAPRSANVLTERELRSIDTPAGRSPDHYKPRFAVPFGRGQQLSLSPAGAPRVHFPDAVIVEANECTTAVELELSAKGRARLRGILRAYAAARHVAHVIYYAASPRVFDLLADEVTGLRAERVIEVRAHHVAAVTADAA